MPTYCVDFCVNGGSNCLDLYMIFILQDRAVLVLPQKRGG